MKKESYTPVANLFIFSGRENYSYLCISLNVVQKQMYKISKQFSFSASHILNKLCDGHPCARMHGHNYVVTVHLRAEELDEYGFVKDYRELEPIKKYIDDILDHRHLNDIIPHHPTAENIARFLYEMFHADFPEMYAVEVSETPKTSAVYEP